MSAFGAKIHKTRHQLTTQLVAKLLGLQRDDENFGLAHDFCLQKEYYHSFGDVNPAAVEAFYAELVQRLQEDSQPSKAAALSALIARLLGMDLACSSTLELNHNLLQLLASLAGQPLDSVLEETPELLQLLYKPAEPQQQQQLLQQQHHVAAVSRFRQLLRGGGRAAAGSDGAPEADASSTAGSSSEDEYDPFAEDSDLTSWESEDEQEQQRQQQRTAVAAAAPAAAQQASDGAEAADQRRPGNSSAGPVVAVYRQPGALQLPPQLQPGRAALSAHQLLGKLTATPPAKLPALWYDRDHCFSEHYLAQQLLRVLQGQQAHGFLLRAQSQAGPGGVVPDTRVTTPALSPGALHALLREFAEAGSAARQLRRLAAQLTQSRGRAWLPSSSASVPQAAAGAESGVGIAGVTITSCLRAFGVALQQQLDLMGQQLADLQRVGLAVAAPAAGIRSTSNTVKQPGITLLLVKQRTRPVRRRLRLLHETVASVLQQLGGCPAAASATLLDGLQEAASAAAVTASGEQGVADAAALLHLLLCSCVPLVAALAQWLWSAGDGAALDDSQLPTVTPAAAAADGGAGSRHNNDAAATQQQQYEGVSCCCEDFFIVKRAAVAATDARFWHAAYGFNQRRAAATSSSSSSSSKLAAAAEAGDTGARAASTGPAADCQPSSSSSSSSRECAVACPAFLLPLASGIMTAGKSVRLLDYMEQEELRRTSFCSSSSSSSSSSSITGVVPGVDGGWLGAAAAQGGSKPRWQPARSSSTGVATQQLGGRPGSSSDSNGFMQQHSLRVAGGSSSNNCLSRQPLGRPRRSSVGGFAGAVSAAGDAPPGAGTGAGSGRHPHAQRKQWSTSGTATAAGVVQQPGTAMCNLTKQVRLQLAVAAAVAGRSEQEQLPQQFIAAACQLLKRQQHVVQPQQPQLATTEAAAGPQAATTPRGAAELILQVLQAAGRQLSQPCADPRETSQQLQQQLPAGGLRGALLAARAHRATTKVAKGTPVEQQHQQQQAKKEEKQQKQQQQLNMADQQPSSPGEAFPGTSTKQPSKVDAAAGASGSPGEEAAAIAAAGSESGPEVPRLLQWRDQLEARLAVAGSCLQHMAPWQQQQQQQQHSKTVEAVSPHMHGAERAGRDAGASTGPLLLHAAASQMPGSFSASLAGLWLLQQPLRARTSVAAAIRRWGDASRGSSADAEQQRQQRLAWLTGDACPGEQLAWLLLDPPRQLPPLPQLLEQVLLAPIQARLELVSSQLLSSLMGEWGLLQQLQGLVSVFLLASPTMVEWCEACFAAAEAGDAAKRHKACPGSAGSAGSDRGAAAGARPLLAGAYAVVLGADELDVVELELLLHDLVSSGDGPGNPLPDPACLHLSINAAALAELRAKKQQQLQADGSQAPASAWAALLGTSGAAATGGLWGCSAEWAGLSCRHSGSWQLSLLYDPEELGRFSMAWRFLMQLRWVRRRLDAARHGACKGTASQHDLARQDSRERAAVAAAMQAAAASRGLAHNRVAEPGSGVSNTSKWLSSRQELLLLQEMGQLMARWQQYVMDRLLRAALPAMLQALSCAGSLDEVRAAASRFLGTVSNLCNARPSGKGAGGTWRHVGKVLGQLMDSCLAAAATASRLRELRQLLAQPGLDAAAVQRSWLELSGLRARLAGVAGSWRSECGYLLRILSVRSISLGDEDDLEALLGCLDANGYFQRLAGLAGPRQ